MRTTLVLQISLLLSAVATVQADDGFPPFSWDRVTLYAHFGLDDKVITSDDYDYLAKYYKLITFSAPVNNIEPSYRVAVRAIKEHNPNIKVMTYSSSTDSDYSL